MRIGPIIYYYNAGHNYIHTLQCNELAIMHGNRFSPLEDFFVNPFSSVLIIMQDITVHVHVRTLVQLLLEEANTHSGTVGYAPKKPQLFR